MKQHLNSGLVSRRRMLAICGASAIALPTLVQSQSQRPLRLVVTLAPGGSSDIVARALGKELESTLGRSVIVDNRPGGQGTVGAQFVATAPADGTTLLFTSSSIVQNTALYKDLPNYLPQLKAVSQIILSPQSLAVSDVLQVGSLSEFVQLAKEKPNTLSIGTVSTLGQILSEMLKAAAGIEFAVIPYRGESQALPDLIGNHISGMIGSPGTLERHGRDNAFKQIAVSSPQRSSSVPNVPTFPEEGYPDMDIAGWLGMFAPVDMPTEVSQQLETAIVAACRTPNVMEQIQNVGMEVSGRNAKEFQEVITRELAIWENAARTLPIKQG